MAAYAYYNELDPYAAVWLRNLIAEGLIAPGDVDERDVREVHPGDLHGYRQCHLFAGIGGWSYALRLAGWPDGRPVWTGSCPCQPLSSAGRRQGHADRRHLWPAFYRLIAECTPAVVFGEQVASRLGREWLAGVRVDLEHLGYACGAADLPAACIGAPHIRQRLWFGARRLADAECGAGQLDGHQVACSPGEIQGEAREQRLRSDARHGGATGGLAHADGVEFQGQPPTGYQSINRKDQGAGRMGDPEINGDGTLRGRSGSRRAPQEPAGGSGLSCGLGDAHRGGRRSRVASASTARHGDPAESTGGNDYDQWLPCTDGKARRVEPGTFPLAHGVPARVGRLRAYGNAIVPGCAAVFIQAFVGAEEVRP